MDRSGQGLAAGRHVPRARGIGGGAAEGFRRDRDDLSGAPGICGAEGERVLVVGVATGKIKATNKAFKDDRVFDITVRNGKVMKIREYIDTQALARASEMDASPRL